MLCTVYHISAVLAWYLLLLKLQLKKTVTINNVNTSLKFGVQSKIEKLHF